MLPAYVAVEHSERLRSTRDTARMPNSVRPEEESNMDYRPPEPVVLDLVGTTFNLADFESGLAVEIAPYQGMMTGDQIHLLIAYDYIDTATITSADVGHPVRLQVPARRLTRGEMRLNYRLDRGDGTTSVSTHLVLSAE